MKFLITTFAYASCLSVLSLPTHAQWPGAETVVGIFDSNQLRAEASPLVEPLKSELAAAGYQVLELNPDQAADPDLINRRKLDVLIYLGADHTIPVGQQCAEFLEQGGRLWYIGELSPFAGVAFTAADEPGRYVPVGSKESEEERRNRGRSANPNAGKVSSSELLTRFIQRGSIYTWRTIEAGKILEAPAATGDGRKLFPDSIDAYCGAAVQDVLKVVSCRSADYPWVRPSCRVIGLSRSKYELPIWAGGRPSTSAGYPLGMIADACGEFGGARTLFAGRAALEQLAGTPEVWSSFVKEAVAALMRDELVAVIEPARAIVRADEPIELELRVDYYRPDRRSIDVDVRAVRRQSDQDGKILSTWSLDLPPRGHARRSLSLPAGALAEGLYDLVLRVDRKVVHNRILSILPGSIAPLARESFFSRSSAGRFVILFRSYDANANNVRLAKETGLHGFSVHIPWIPEGHSVETSVNWSALDRWIEDAKANGMKVIIDAWDHRPYPEYFIHFKQADPRKHWEKYPSLVVTENHRRWEALWGAVAKRYAPHKNVVAMFLAPGAQSSFQIDLSDHSAADFAGFLRATKSWNLPDLAERHEMVLESWDDVRPPDVDKPAGNMFARILDYHDFWKHQHLQFLDVSAGAIHAAAPEMPLLLRGPYDYGPNFRHAAELMKKYGPISIHAENVETTVNTHTPMFGSHLRYGVPISAENGWPANRGEPARHAYFKALMGHYTAFLYSGGGSNQLLPNLDVLAEYAYLDALLKRVPTRPVTPRVAALINETSQLFPAVSMPLDPKWKTPRFHRVLFRQGYPAMATNIDQPELRGIDIAMDGGENALVRQSVLRSLLRWVSDGHTLVISDKMAAYNESGPVAPLASQLQAPGTSVYGIPAENIGPPETFPLAAEESAVQSVRVGNGRVVLLNELQEDQMDGTIGAVLDKLGANRPISCEPPLPLAIRESDDALYVILYDVDTDTIGGYFNYDDAAEDLEISDTFLHLNLTAPFAPSSAVNLATGRTLEVQGKEVRLTLRKGHGAVVKLVRPGTDK